MLADMLPFTRDEFLAVFAAYNEGSWPAALLAYPFAVAAVSAAWRGTPVAGRWAAFLLALFWSFVGVVYHTIYFSRINPVATAFGAAFIVQGALFAAVALTGRGLVFGASTKERTLLAGAMILYAMVAYPLIGLGSGERYPAMPLFGVAPCPLLIFTFALMVWARVARWWLWIIPLGWSAVGGSASMLLDVRQDWALPASAVMCLSIKLAERLFSSKPSRQSGTGRS